MSKIIRARVIEGSLPMPVRSDNLYAYMTEDNFEIIAMYTKENLKRIFEIGKEAYINGTLSKFEILGWDGGAANHDGDRFLWLIRPDMCNFERLDTKILSNFDEFEPIAFDKTGRDYYDKFWKPLKFGLSLSAYESEALSKQKSLMYQINQARVNSKLNLMSKEQVMATPER